MTAINGGHIRQAEPQEAAILSALALRSKAHWGYSPDFMAACKEELAYTSAEMSDKSNVFNVVIQADNIVGFYKLAMLGHQKILLEALFVEPEFIGLGLGGTLFQHAKQTAINHKGAFLEVQSDPNAQAFYQKCGMTVIGKQQSGSVAGRYLPLLTMPLSLGSRCGR